MVSTLISRRVETASSIRRAEQEGPSVKSPADNCLALQLDMGQATLLNFTPYSAGDQLQTSESDIYRRQILTSKVDPRREIVKYL